jgi:uncharacterized Fe-S cluster protein YjdI
MHATVGYSSQNKTNAANNVIDHINKDKIKSYVENKIRIQDNRKICSYAAEYLKNLL